MALNCELLPHDQATTEQLKRLGHALLTWCNSYLDELIEAGREVDGWWDMDSFDSLLAGELPPPFALRCAAPGLKTSDVAEAIATARAHHTLGRRCLPDPTSRAVVFGFALGDADIENMIASLSCHVPLELVACVRINGRECVLAR